MTTEEEIEYSLPESVVAEIRKRLEAGEEPVRIVQYFGDEDHDMDDVAFATASIANELGISTDTDPELPHRLWTALKGWVGVLIVVLFCLSWTLSKFRVLNFSTYNGESKRCPNDAF